MFWLSEIVAFAGIVTGVVCVQPVAAPETVQSVVGMAPLMRMRKIRPEPAPGGTVSCTEKLRSTVGTDGLRDSESSALPITASPDMAQSVAPPLSETAPVKTAEAELPAAPGGPAGPRSPSGRRTTGR